MININLKGMLNQNSLLRNDESNISNGDNQNVYSKIIKGNVDSEMFSYLLNLNHQRLNDFKSMMAYNESNQAAIINESQQINEITEGNNVIFLPKKKVRIKADFFNVLEKRRSVRSFSGVKMTDKNLSAILQYSFGIAQRKVYYGEIETTTRYYASGGGLYPITIYIYVKNVDAIANGLYQYQPISHSILKISKNRNIDVDSFFVGDNIDVENMNFSIFFGYSISSNYLKYGELALLNTLIEVGGMSHNFDIVCTALGFSSCPIAGLKKTFLEEILNYDHVNEHVLFSNICGKE